MKFGIRNLLVLIKVSDRRIQLRGLRVGLLRHLLRLTGLGASLLGLLICRVRRALRLMDTSLGAAINILDIVRVLGGKLIELVQPIFYRGYLTIYPLLTGQWVHFSPETLGRLRWQRLSGSVSRRICRGTRSARGGRAAGAGVALVCGAPSRSRGILRNRWHA